MESSITRKNRALFSFLACLVLTICELSRGILHAAKSGRVLPRLTLMLPLQFGGYQLLQSFAKTRNVWHDVSIVLLVGNFAMNALGYSIVVLLYRYSVQTIFNRQIPRMEWRESSLRPQPHPAIKSFNTHLLLLRPLEVFFRFMTVRFRVLPDIIVLGETRCGTTTLCSHLSSLSKAGETPTGIKCYTPFCPWVHPELDNKESFYFVGHYLGIVDPYFYRMAFPLKITRWWEEKIMGNIFFCFDGCAQYLTSPTAAYLIANAYQNYENGDPPVLVVCVRDPVEQAISWWKFENDAMRWGSSMGLKSWNTALRSKNYPPQTIVEALQFSNSEFVRNAYLEAEQLAQSIIPTSNRGTKCNIDVPLKLGVIRLPQWALTWPAGQLSTIGRSGRFDSNIQRYNRIFSSVFGNIHAENADKTKSFVHVVPLDIQTNGVLLKDPLHRILSDMVMRRAYRYKQCIPTLISIIDRAIDCLCDFNKHGAVRRNSSSTLEITTSEPNARDVKTLQDYFCSKYVGVGTLTKN
mmetsp:Transcript_21185/g.44351  ORF Transcript_21185/g.44351 Transcript_21185/m.44351 type:complete len:521 (+) Transcript_21185:118-1680(+)